MTPLSPETNRAMLAHLSLDGTCDAWADVATALKSELGEAGLDIFDAWRQRGEKYLAADVRSTWRSNLAGGGVTVSTLVHPARAAGWGPDAVQTPRHALHPATAADDAHAQKARRVAANAERQQQQAQRRERALHACELWLLAAEAGEAPYLARKGLSGSHGARFAPGDVPSAGQPLAVCGRMV